MVYFVVIVIIPSLVNAMMLVISVHRYETNPPCSFVSFVVARHNIVLFFDGFYIFFHSLISSRDRRRFSPGAHIVHASFDVHDRIHMRIGHTVILL